MESSSPYGGESGEEDGSSGEGESDIMKETEQELLDEMIVKDVPESESTTDPVRRFEETNVTSAGIESIQEAQEDSDSECKDQSFNNLVLASNIPQPSYPNISLTKSPQPQEEKKGGQDILGRTETKILVKSASSSELESEEENLRQPPAAAAAPAEALTTTDSEAVISRPSSSDISGIVDSVWCHLI